MARDAHTHRHVARLSRKWRSAILMYCAVSTGGALGAVLRWTVSLAFTSDGFPWATLIANVAGSLLIGFFAQVTGPSGRMMAGPRTHHFVMTGLLGGFTTFSIFSLETLRLAEAQAYWSAGAYVALSLVTWLAAVWLGDAAARRYSRLRGART